MKLSVIVPVENEEHKIQNIIEHILEQKVDFNYEIIVVDNNSIDNTPLIVRDLSINYSNVLIAENKKELTYNQIRNQGLHLSKGKYVTFYNHNTNWRSNKLQTQVDNLDKHSKSVLCFSNIGLIDNDHGIIGNHFLKYPFFRRMINNKKTSQVCKNIFDVIIKENLIDFDNVLIRKEPLLKKGGFDENLDKDQDWDLLLKLAKDYKFSFNNEILMDKELFGENTFNEKNVLRILKKYKKECHPRTYNIAKSNCYAYIADELFFLNKKKESFKYYLKSLKTFFQIRVLKEFMFKLAWVQNF